MSDLSFDPAWGRIYVAGGFTRVGGDAHPGVAAIDAEDKTAPATGTPFAALRGLLGKKD